MAISALRLGMVRRAEEFTNDFMKLSKLPAGPILLSHINKKMDQPISAIKSLNDGLSHDKENLILLSNLARIEEERYVENVLIIFHKNIRGESSKSISIYEKILKRDPSNREALCVIAAEKYYDNDAVKSFSLYRRTLQSGTGFDFYMFISV